jgi:golgin subfamily B member 1
MSAFRRLGQSELLPRYIFIESLFVRRRVLEVGAVASTAGQSARFLLQRGARDVVACDDDLDAVEEAQHRLGQEHLRYRPSVFEDLDAGGFDVVLVTDLAPYVRAPLLLAELARRVARNGWLVGALRNPAGLALSQLMDPERGDAPPTYGHLLDALTAHLPSVQVATQSPLLGYQLAFDSAEGLQVDGSLAGQGEAAWFVVFAGVEPVRAFEPTWVQLPAEPLAFTSGQLEEAAERVRAWEDRGYKLKSALDKARAEMESRQAEIAEAREMQAGRAEVEREADALRKVASSLDQRVSELEPQLQEAHARCVQLEQDLGSALDAEKSARQRVEAELAAAKQQAAERDARVESLQRRLNAQESELVALRRAVGRSAATPQVQQIYERASAELEAVKADLLKRSVRLAKVSSGAPIARLVAAAPKPLPPSAGAASTSASAEPGSRNGAPALARVTPLPLPGERDGGGAPLGHIDAESSDDDEAIILTFDEDDASSKRR